MARDMIYQAVPWLSLKEVLEQLEKLKNKFGEDIPVRSMCGFHLEVVRKDDVIIYGSKIGAAYTNDLKDYNKEALILIW